jgi:pimeloyl-ACP methyl ester carboxylesterase
VLILPWGCHVELAWEVPAIRSMFERFGSFARLVNFDKRGVGLSDRSVGIASPETRMDDIRAVMDAVGSKRAAIMGWSEGVELSLLFAATYPDRAWALIAYGGRLGMRRASADVLREDAEERASRERDAAGYALEESRGASPNATDEEVAALAHMFRYALAPGDEYAYTQMNRQIRVEHVLYAIAIPTLVLHNAEDGWVGRDEAREVAARVPGATYAEVPVVGHVPCLAQVDPVVEAIESFLREAWEADAVEQEPERVLATVLFTDIVDSTAKGRGARRPGLARATRAAPCRRPTRVGPRPRQGDRHRGRRLLRQLRRARAGDPLRPRDRGVGAPPRRRRAGGPAHRRV